MKPNQVVSFENNQGKWYKNCLSQIVKNPLNQYVIFCYLYAGKTDFLVTKKIYVKLELIFFFFLNKTIGNQDDTGETDLKRRAWKILVWRSLLRSRSLRCHGSALRDIPKNG